jgi:integrase
MARFGELCAPRSLVKFGDLLDRYQREVVPRKAPRTQTDNLRYIAQLRKTFGEWPKGEVTKATVREFRDKLGARSGPVQANRHLELLKHLFRVALTEWDADIDRQVLDVRKLEVQKRGRYVSEAEFLAVRSKTPPMMQCAMDLALLTGLRRGDLLMLTRADCTDEGISVTPSKTLRSSGKKIVVEWSPELIAVVERAKKLKPVFRQHLIATRQGKPFTGAGDGFGSIFRRAVKRAMDAKLIAEPFAFNDIRSKSASDTKNLQEASERLGHTNTAVTLKHYIRKPRRVKPLR